MIVNLEKLTVEKTSKNKNQEAGDFDKRDKWQIN